MNILYITLPYLLFVAVESVRVLPRPLIDIENVTSHSITLVWNLPPNEISDGSVVEIRPEEGEVMEHDPTTMRREFVNLTPGKLYTFTVRMYRDDSFSEPSVIVQDTVPVIPRELVLRTFDTLVLTLEGPYFGGTEFTVETHGIEAEWESPGEGVADCFVTEITSEEGLTATPAEHQEISRGEPLRQFINLTPGQVYKVTVYAATCGDGHMGELRSDPISAQILIPPSSPPTPFIEEEETSIEITWGEPEGDYDDFEIIETTETGIIVDEITDRKFLGRNISGLRPCTEYNFEIYSLLGDLRSESPTVVSAITKPQRPSNVSIASFTSTSITFEFDAPSNPGQEFEIRLSPSGRTIRTTGPSVTVRDLIPGIKYTATVNSVCIESRETTSSEIITTEQTTKPQPPVVTTECQYIGVNESHIPLYESVPWDAPQYSRIVLKWEPPVRGNWENFVVDYSPHVFEEGRSHPGEPVILSRETTTTTVAVPVTGRVLSVTLRTMSNNVLSEPAVESAYCGEESILRCKSILLFWKIIIRPIPVNRLMITIPDFPIYNATVHIGDEVSVFYTRQFNISDPCITYPLSTIVVYPRCPDFLPFCPVIIRSICPPRITTDKRIVEYDGCCHNRLYNKNEAVCCHNKLLTKKVRTTEECCVKRWYDYKTHTCCPGGQANENDDSC